MDYLQVDISTTTPGIDPVGALLLDLGAGGYTVQDPADFKEFLDTGRWDYVDETVMALAEGGTTLSVYLPLNEQGTVQLAELESGLARLRAMDGEGAWGALTTTRSQVQEQDWAEAWKRYYHTIRVGERLIVRPSWEAYEAGPGEVVLEMDPGMAFGSGIHESTRLCLALLEERVSPGARVLDVGCGSGILAVASLLLGAARAVGVDIEEVAVRTARDNAVRNGVAERASFHTGSLSDGVDGVFDVVAANIVADVILSFAPDVPGLLAPGGAFLVSGIIDTRGDEVQAALEKMGFRIAERREDGGWVAVLAERAGPC